MLQRRVVLDAVCSILVHEADANFQRSRQAVVVLDHLCAHPGIAHTSTALGFHALRNIVETPPMFGGQACAHTLLRAALDTIARMWKEAITAPPTAAAATRHSNPESYCWATQNDVYCVMKRVVDHRILDPRWEVRESVISFIASLMYYVAESSKADKRCSESIMRFVQSEDTLKLLWNTRKDEASFVQASVWDTVKICVQTKHGFCILGQKLVVYCCTDASALLKELVAASVDSEAIVRRVRLLLFLFHAWSCVAVFAFVLKTPFNVPRVIPAACGFISTRDGQ